MGRCYEFGVSIDDGCEHAMSVVGEGGACECTACAAHCPGRFAGCAEVVARPGYVPALAPARARSGHPAASARPALSLPRLPSASPVPDARRPLPVDRLVGPLESELAVIRELVEKLLDARSDAELATLHAGMQARDEALTEVFDRLTAAQERLAGEVRSATTAQGRLVELAEGIERRVAELEQAVAARSGVKDWLRRLG